MFKIKLENVHPNELLLMVSDSIYFFLNAKKDALDRKTFMNAFEKINNIFPFTSDCLQKP